MRVVNLASGGLDSTLVSVLIHEEDLELHPLFIDYGQRARDAEWYACRRVYAHLALPPPVRMDVAGFGDVIKSGLTSFELDILDDAFTPTRNLMFLVMGSAYACEVEADRVAIGLLNEESSLFPDQKADFIHHAQAAIRAALGHTIEVITPLAKFSKIDVIRMAESKGVSGTYSCHSGLKEPCGRCIACHEFGIRKE